MDETNLFWVGSVSSEATDEWSTISEGRVVTSLELSNPIKALDE